MSVANGAAALAKVFCPFVPVAPASFLAKAKGFVDGLDKDSNVADFSSVQDEVEGGGEGGRSGGGSLGTLRTSLPSTTRARPTRG